MPKSYTSKDVRVLEEVEHIRLNPAMYIGDTQNPVHLIEEALDNALDEALAGYAKIIAVIIDTKQNKFSVLDDGRGIPIENDTPIIVSRKLFSGAKFRDQKNAYEISSGLHGVGLVAVNGLSSSYTVEIYRDGKHAKFDFIDANLKKSHIEKFTETRPFSTKIEFIPDKKFFETLSPDIKRIRKRLTTAAAEMPVDISCILVVDDDKEIFQLTEETHFLETCIDQQKDLKMRKFIANIKPESFEILMAYEEDSTITPRIMSSVNLLPVDSGGSHINAFLDMLKDFYITKGKKLNYEFQPNDCFCGLRLYLILKMIDPRFAGQTKEKVTNAKSDFDKFIKVLRIQFDEYSEKYPDEINADLERFQEYRKKQDSKKLQLNGTGSKRASARFTKLRDCTSRFGELFIVEGDSAGGSIIISRDPKIHAVLPLKGKSIPNITTKKKILENKEVGELVKAIGTGLPPNFDISKLRYDKLICATDADHDGAHIACLVTMLVAILLPDIIKAGKYFIAQTPLFAINEKKAFIPLWNDEQLEKARKEKRNIQRYKGLGEMNPEELKVCLLDEPTRHLIPIKYSDNIEELVKLFSSAIEKRELVVGEE